jgi:lysophospholipase L1-like esterase
VRTRDRAIRLALPLAACAFGLALGEAGLRLLEGRGGGRARLVEDPLLGFRMAPGAPGHDARGFRNASALDTAELVAIGDSQTWGVNARVQEAWPQQAGALLGVRAYNMSQGSWGGLHYASLLPEALALRPRVVVFGLYLGNDLYDSYRLVYMREAHASLRRPDLGPPADRQRQADALWAEHVAGQASPGLGRPAAWSLWLRGHTAIGRLLERAGVLPGDAWFEAGAAWARDHPTHGAVCDCGATRTVLTTAYRLLAVDLDDPGIREGLRLTRLALERGASACAAARVRFLVLVIPTKERVYADRMRSAQPLDPAYARLVGMEDRVREAILAGCTADGIECVDALPPLAAAVDAGTAVYPSTTESHPSARGYRVLAELVAARLR